MHCINTGQLLRWNCKKSEFNNHEGMNYKNATTKLCLGKFNNMTSIM